MPRNEDVHIHGTYNPAAYTGVPGSEKLKPHTALNVFGNSIKNVRRHKLKKRNSDINSSNNLNSDSELDFVKKIFEMHGDGQTMNIQGFRSFLNQLRSHNDQGHSIHSDHAMQTEMLKQENKTDLANQTVRFYFQMLK